MTNARGNFDASKNWGTIMSSYQSLKRSIRRNAAILCVVGIGISLPSISAYAADAADTINFGQGQWISIGAGLRADTTSASAFSAATGLLP